MIIEINTETEEIFVDSRFTIQELMDTVNMYKVIDYTIDMYEEEEKEEEKEKEKAEPVYDDIQKDYNELINKELRQESDVTIEEFTAMSYAEKVNMINKLVEQINNKLN